MKEVNYSVFDQTDVPCKICDQLSDYFEENGLEYHGHIGWNNVLYIQKDLDKNTTKQFDSIEDKFKKFKGIDFDFNNISFNMVELPEFFFNISDEDYWDEEEEA